MRARLAALAFGALLAAAPAPAQTVWDGAYAADQAARGDALYARHCAACHGPAMDGAMTGPALSGAGFLYVWDGRPLSELGQIVRATMPPAAIGALREDEIAALLAAILQRNGWPAGARPLPAGTEAQSAILIARDP